MLSSLNKIKFIVLAFVFFIFLIQYSASSTLENEELEKLMQRLERMQTKMDALENKNDKWTKKLSDLEAENEKLKTANLQQDEQFQYLKSQIISQPKFSSISVAKPDDGQSSKVFANPPTSCQDLKNQNGKKVPIDGIHLLKINNTIQAALCTFADDGSSVFESLIGKVDVKTKIVHFYVQRNSSFSAKYSVIPFELARLNEGNAFNLTSGIFTAPVPGIYHFDFSAVKSTSDSLLKIHLQVNGVAVGATYTYQTSDGSFDVISLSASLRLTAGDTVNLYHGLRGDIMDGIPPAFTHFSGWLVEEDLM